VTKKGANLTASILIDLFSKGLFKNLHTLVIQWDGASENVAKTNWRLVIWLLLRKSGLKTIILCRLEVGHTHFLVDQHHSVFSMHIRGNGKMKLRKEVHSLGRYSECAREAHSDLIDFIELGEHVSTCSSSQHKHSHCSLTTHR